ncbi:tRNA1(Val) (adenine(37)-N6)-methyltransferase [Dysgonomonas sp. 25]|uniref:tRNA1(Val) (adenine(37)-N6)-methyltransferase n=1 Tax=Dysgonomonas sp. 25 TaxID=2302933 RepID=UPI0013CF9F1D|nr:methyltransferase [Dysgonomonas sp. 25]NDV68906.1 methyltransferase domain-containing protein [Dysgonomonas sp. 25]
MPNDYFQFKQFTVRHGRCAMKVGTDGVLLGAWASAADAKKILDIGTGSGLIALMLAQRNPQASVTAIDIDADAILQADENFEASPFAGRIACKHIPLADYATNTAERFDLIVSNPPFFIDSLKSPDNQRSLARHTDSLPMEELIGLSSRLLTDKGRIALIYPYEQKERMIAAAERNNLSVSRITTVYPIPGSTPKRVLMELDKTTTLLHNNVLNNNLIIEGQRHVYSGDFVHLIKDFYLRY